MGIKASVKMARGALEPSPICTELFCMDSMLARVSPRVLLGYRVIFMRPSVRVSSSSAIQRKATVMGFVSATVPA